MRILLPVAVLVMLLSGAASALTVQEVVALSKAGVSDEVLLSLIERDKTIFAIDHDQLMALTRDRVSEKVVLAMLRSGRQEPPPPGPAHAVPAAPTDTVPAAPGALMFGHGPSRPNTYHDYDQLGLGGPLIVYPAPYVSIGQYASAGPYVVTPYLVPAALAPSPCLPAARTDRTVGIADASGRFVNNGLLPTLAAAGGSSVVCQPPAPPAPASRSPRRARR
ncbi:MAG: hypothetical protein ABI868_16855 [Acidobacteriota bacterium]